MTMVIFMKKIPAGEFKAHCLALMDEVKAKRESVIITKYGQPVAMLVPPAEQMDDIYGFLEGKGSIVGDIVAPALSAKDWGSLK
jgi:prevent-host-death family protein